MKTSMQRQGLRHRLKERSYRLLLLAAIAVQSMIHATAFAQASADEGADDALETIFVIGQRRAYQGNFRQSREPGGKSVNRPRIAARRRCAQLE